MPEPDTTYRRRRLPAEIVNHAARLYRPPHMATARHPSSPPQSRS